MTKYLVAACPHRRCPFGHWMWKLATRVLCCGCTVFENITFACGDNNAVIIQVFSRALSNARVLAGFVFFTHTAGHYDLRIFCKYRMGPLELNVKLKIIMKTLK